MSKTKIQNILIGLDLSPRDDYVLSFLSQNTAAFDTETLHFLHVKESEVSEPTEAKIKDKLSHKIQNIFLKGNISTELHLLSGDPTKEITNRINNQKIDLLVIGYERSEYHKLETQKLVKKPACSLLLIPEKKDYSLNKIGIALDFSDLSQYALQNAASIAKTTGAEIIGLHTYEVPTGYHTSGKDHQEYAKIMEENARKEAEVFLDKAGIDNIKIEYVYDEKGKTAECIAQLAKKSNVDLLLIGSKGRTNAASILMGSVAKNLVKTFYDIPLMVVKVKNENMDFTDAIKKV